MRKALVMSMLFALAGCGPNGSAEEEVMNPQSAAILRVLQRHAQLVEQRAEAEALQTQVSQVALVWRRFCEELERMDLSDGGIGRLESQYRSAYERGAATYAEVERTAVKYGVAL